VAVLPIKPFIGTRASAPEVDRPFFTEEGIFGVVGGGTSSIQVVPSRKKENPTGNLEWKDGKKSLGSGGSKKEGAYTVRIADANQKVKKKRRTVKERRGATGA